GDRLAVLSGDDSLTLPVLSVGGLGVISVVSNVVPADVTALVARYLAGDVAAAARLHRKLFPLIKAMFVETNPIPVKAALAMLGMAAGEPRLPLVLLSDAGRRAVRAALVSYGLLKK
ncbi:dihydrodipicolinate synthase family protein, partial [candidate division WOR-3 bacterium]|nr:dihydrodipicolinate synthase family protein [candidate division WOR-3 bacterium]